ncbi:MAG TPA: DUF4180 domain-containing protein [Anaerolineae bacterium]
MPFKIQKAGHTQYIEADPTNFVIRNERDILDLISGCIEHDANQVMLYEANLSPEFFDLKTTLAGELFQKLANYHLRGAGIISLDRVTSDRFKELMFECNRGNLFRFFEDKATAEKWLAGE